MSDRAVAAAIDAIVARQPVDWKQAEALHPHHAGVFRQLRSIGELVTTSSGQHAPDASAPSLYKDWRLARWLIIVIALAQIVAAIVGYFAGSMGPSAVPPVVQLVALVVNFSQLASQ